MSDETKTILRPDGPPPPLGVVIRVRGARAIPDTLRLSSGKCTLGSGKSADMVIAETTISRAHAELELVPEGVRVRDLGSRNGTFYLGQRVEQIILAPGAKVTLGNTDVFVDADHEALAQCDVYEGDTFRGLIGSAVATRRLFSTIARLDGTLINVLVTGPSGVGKELVSRAIHDGSRVSEGPWVAVNCAAIPRELATSALFGHRRGAFTGAVDSHRGAFQRADRGTLFLDEIGELPLDVQPMLLRTLETGEVQPVGGEHSSTVDVRLVAATNRDLLEEVRAGRFREDLYYRIAVVNLEVPPLSARAEDIEPLARHFAEQAGLSELPSRVLEGFKRHSWPGNVRELRNAVQAYAALGDMAPSRFSGESLGAALTEHLSLDRPFSDQRDELVEHFTRLYLTALMERTGGNQSQAARLSGIDRTYLGRMLTRYGLSR